MAYLVTNPPEVRKCVMEYHVIAVKGKGRGAPLQAWTGPWDYRRLRLPEFLNSRHSKVVGLSAQGIGLLYLQETSLVLFSVRD
jgi:hypothetical protein